MHLLGMYCVASCITTLAACHTKAASAPATRCTQSACCSPDTAPPPRAAALDMVCGHARVQP